MKKADEGKTQVNIKLWQDTMDILSKVQGYGMMHSNKESQSEIIDRLLRAEWSRIQKEMAKERVPA